MRQKRDVFFAVAQRRNVDWHDIQAVIKIFAEATLFESGAEIDIGCGDDTNIHVTREVRAEAFKLALLQECAAV